MWRVNVTQKNMCETHAAPEKQMCVKEKQRCVKMNVQYYYSVSPRINEKGGGDLAGAQSMKLYLGAWCMYILHS